ncbi:MAG: HEAT repeat domain-containing protein [Acidobacteriota bacterium]
MLHIADLFLAVLRPFLLVSGLALVSLLVFLVLKHGVDEIHYRRRQRIIAHYRPVVDSLLGPVPSDDVFLVLSRVPARHRPVLETMLLRPLALSTGSVVDRLRNAARVSGLIDEWATKLSDRRWWIRAEATRALGLAREIHALPRIYRALDDDHEEVRAAAVESLGLIRHPDAIQALLERLADQSRHQRARVVEALREFGDRATPALIAHARRRPEDAVMVAEVLEQIGGHEAADEMKSWTLDERPDVRAAALHALGTIGLDDEGVALTVRSLEAPEAPVRAMAARALGRVRRADIARVLATHLDDEWLVAATAADALRKTGRAGIDLLEARVSDAGYAGDLARQMLWERRTAAAGGLA